MMRRRARRGGGWPSGDADDGAPDGLKRLGAVTSLRQRAIAAARASMSPQHARPTVHRPSAVPPVRERGRGVRRQDPPAGAAPVARLDRAYAARHHPARDLRRDRARAADDLSQGGLRRGLCGARNLRRPARPDGPVPARLRSGDRADPRAAAELRRRGHRQHLAGRKAAGRRPLSRHVDNALDRREPGARRHHQFRRKGSAGLAAGGRAAPKNSQSMHAAIFRPDQEPLGGDRGRARIDLDALLLGAGVLARDPVRLSRPHRAA